MKTLLLLFLATLSVFLNDLRAQTTAFAYQGRFSSNGSPFTGAVELQPTLWDAATSGTQIAAHNPATVTAAVSNGLFTVDLDFGSAPFGTGADRWLQFEARTAVGPFIMLSPRQKLSPTPYAFTARSLAGILPDAQLSPNVSRLGQSIEASEIADGSVTTAKLGDGSVNSAKLSAGSVSESKLADRSVTETKLADGSVNDRVINALVAARMFSFVRSSPPFSLPLRMQADSGLYPALELLVKGERALRIEYPANASAGAAPNVIGGSSANLVDDGIEGAAIGGGGWSFEPNRVGGPFGAIIGGYGNTAAGLCSTAGGHQSTASGRESIAIGELAAASGHYSTAFGAVTTASGSYSTALGHRSVAGGEFSIAMGDRSQATSSNSFAGGRRALARHPGSFIWCDSLEQDGASAGNNTFTVRASGGTYFFSSSGNTGVRLPAGSGSWTSLSDRASKTNFAFVDGRAILERLAAIPMQSWNYIAQGDQIRHLGPVAQDFRAAFGLGEDEKHIAIVDADGVALAAIQGLNQKLNEELKRRDLENAELRKELLTIKNMLKDLGLDKK